DPIFYPDRDLIKEFYKPAAPQLRLNANMSGGTEVLHYFINIGYIGQGSNFKTVYNEKYDFDPAFKMNRYNFRGNLDFDATKNLKISLNLASYLQKANAPNYNKVGFGDVDGMINEALAFIMGADPTQPGPLTIGGTTTPDGTSVPAGLPTLQMPSPRSAYGVLNGYGYSWESRATLNSSLSVEWKLPFITQGLSAKALIAYDSEGYESSDGSLVVNYVQYQIGREEGEKSYYIMPNVDRFDPLVLYKSSSGKYYADMQFSLNYDRLFGKHAVTGMVLAQRENKDDWGGALPFNVLGVSGRFTYGYDDRYLAEVNMGYNGSEQFAPSNRFGFFPALSAGWVVSNESFIKGSELLTNLKLRASYGKVGNDKILNDQRFLYLDNIQSAGGGLPSLGRGGSYIFYALYGNPNLQWEEAWKQNYGLDFQLWGELSLTADVFFEDRSKILIWRESIPDLLGVPATVLPPMNMGRVKNRGFEVELVWQKIFSRDLSVNTRANFGFNRNKIIETDEPPLGEEYYYRYRKTGFPIGQPFGYMIDYSNGNGYINTQEELDNLPAYNIGGAPRLGDFMYKDMNGDGTIDPEDQVPIGYSGVPEISYGWSASTNWKDFDFSFLLQGIANVSMAYTGFRWNEPALQHAWTKERYESGDEIQYPALNLTNSGPSYTNNSFFLLDRSFLRLKTAEIGYTLPAEWTKKVGVSRMRVYVNGNNLLTFTPMKAKYNDPEQDSSAKFPLAKMVNFGLNVTF
ncbi:MAG: SusC/RagA family TonB-linked outer membrane protein, partial [Candidatus Symbiothrix sp.]|nr:SusC/RagA family TonB-linked outer membrane protein [Candidatus Symbiothrix sp.]